MATATDINSLLASAKGGVLTLDPPGKEFQGPLVVRRPVTINGNGCTIWAEAGPVVVIESTGVTLGELNIEVTGTEESLAGEAACALVARTAAPTLSRVAVRGLVVGIPGEEGEWRYPRIVRLNRIAAGTAHTFTLRLTVPVDCRIESMVSGVVVAPQTLRAGEVEVAVRVEAMAEGIRLRGLLRLSTVRLTRRIELSGHVVAVGTGVATGTGQVLFQPADWSGTAAAVPPAPPPAPAAPPPPKPSPAPRPAPPPTAAAPPPVVPPPPALPPPAPKPKARYRFPTTAGDAFAPPPPPPEPIENENEAELPYAIPESTPPIPEPPPSSDPLTKKPGMRKTNRPGGAFGVSPPSE